jgi:DinB superfamily
VEVLRQHVIDLLTNSHAHVDLLKAFADFPRSLRGVRPPGYPHSAWELLEHARIVQWDILEFSRNPAHQSPEFPGGYWPAAEAPPDERAWKRSLAQVEHDLAAMAALVQDPASDLFRPFSHGDGQTLLREALLVADHNAYHAGQVVMLRRILGAWE